MNEISKHKEQNANHSIKYEQRLLTQNDYVSQFSLDIDKSSIQLRVGTETYTKTTRCSQTTTTARKGDLSTVDYRDGQVFVQRRYAVLRKTKEASVTGKGARARFDVIGATAASANPLL